jgi:hypothetical protein
MRLEVGDTVSYSAAFLRNTGQMVGDTGKMRGVVEAIKEMKGGCPRLISVKWNDGTPSRVLESNLAKPGPNIRFCQC